MTKRFARRTRLATLLLVAGLFSPLLAEAQEVASTEALRSPSAVEAYWTPERMQRAKPMPLPTLQGGPRPADSAGADAAAGAMVLAPGGKPGTRPTELVGTEAEAALRQAGGPAPQFAAGTFAYTRYRLFPNTNAAYKVYPYSAIGQLFFTIPGQGDFLCSGAAINSANDSVVWTAGHCVNTPGLGFHTNFLFQPARREGAVPFGSWTWRAAFTTTQWANTGQFEFDLGALVMNRGGTSGSAKIADAVGFLGYLSNTSREQHWNLHGWPAAPRNLAQTPPGAQFDGLHHEICTAAFGATDDPSGNGGALANGVGCDKTGGTSGGPWIVDFTSVNGANFVNGNNSYRYTGPNPPENLKLFSPHFANPANAVRNAAQNVNVP